MSVRELVARSPVTGEVLATFKVPTEPEVAEAVARSRAAFPGWRDAPLAHRTEFLRRLKNLIIDEADAIVEAIVAATGKVHVEALAGDVLTSW